MKPAAEILATESGLLTVKAAGKFLGLSAGSVHDLAESGKLVAVELAGQRFFSRRALQDFRWKIIRALE